MKKAVIATNTSGIREIIKNMENGLLTNNSVNDVVEKILYLKNNESNATALGKNGWKTISQKFSVKNALKKYKRITFS